MTEKSANEHDSVRNKDVGSYRVNEPRELAKNLARLLEEGSKMLISLSRHCGGYKRREEVQRLSRHVIERSGHLQKHQHWRHQFPTDNFATDAVDDGSLLLTRFSWAS